jgi:hypothetical protein
MKLVKPNYSKRTPVVNDTHYNDAKIGSPNSTFNPGATASPLPTGPPKFIQPPGKRIYAKGLTNKRLTQNI